ncbi:MAG: 30S ribosomal protein S19e [Candidatus Aenigmarchaeota archaeon]|nr:30S ribosomal protein S19e [Candidatus Aenigmarchaeota archaeon]NIQ17765.1 30S ribosomal protein S19e [Candidatus Aenigmarchaeota archaeon]NIS73085.1 30S ribosomal protein S19e [Candidatus Aenigmarchaeota archaeon]
MKSVSADRLIEETAKKLGKMEEMKPPEWAKFVKTGVCMERIPSRDDWWFVRSASILRKLSSNESFGISKLRKVYGGRKRRGHKPEHKYPASGAVTRKILQQLEKAGFVKTEKGKGRSITAKGKVFLNEIVKTLGG